MGEFETLSRPLLDLLIRPGASQGVFPHGIDVLRKIDFFTVSVRHRAYLDAAPLVAA